MIQSNEMAYNKNAIEYITPLCEKNDCPTVKAFSIRSFVSKIMSI